MLGTGTFKTIVSSVRRSLTNSQLYTRSYADGNVNVTKVNTNIMQNQHFFTNYSSRKNLQLKYTPRRAVMYVPGNDWKKINKIPSMKADSFILDCEDGVAINRKVSFVCCKYHFSLVLFNCRRKKLETTLRKFSRSKCSQQPNLNCL
jgi:citrate lyase subunit beta-like protein